MLKRPLNIDQGEYEIQDSTCEVDIEFYNRFIDVVNKTKFDMVEHQIIVNPFKYIVEVRIKMEKLQVCFSNQYSLDMIFKRPQIIIENTLEIPQRYVKKLCFKD